LISKDSVQSNNNSERHKYVIFGPISISTSEDFECPFSLIKPSNIRPFKIANEIMCWQITNGKILLETQKYGEIELGEGCSFVTSTCTIRYDGERSSYDEFMYPLFMRVMSLFFYIRIFDVTSLEGSCFIATIYTTEPIN
jgi:hypothetical protein